MNRFYIGVATSFHDPALAMVNSKGEVVFAESAAFYKLTGVPMLLNTSFNIMGKPIMHSVEDALGLFYTTGLDVLVIEEYLIEK